MLRGSKQRPLIEKPEFVTKYANAKSQLIELLGMVKPATCWIIELYTKSSPKGQDDTGAYKVGVHIPWIHELPDALK